MGKGLYDRREVAYGVLKGIQGDLQAEADGVNAFCGWVASPSSSLQGRKFVLRLVGSGGNQILEITEHVNGQL